MRRVRCNPDAVGTDAVGAARPVAPRTPSPMRLRPAPAARRLRLPVPAAAAAAFTEPERTAP